MPVLIVSLVVGMLAVGRLTRLLVDDEITVGIRRWFVKKYGEDHKLTYFIHCPWCTSIWIAALIMPALALLVMGISWLSVVLAFLLIPATSMAAGLLNKWGS
jgi:hypothetical protein